MSRRGKVDNDGKQKHESPVGPISGCEAAEVLDLALFGVRADAGLWPAPEKRLLRLLTSHGVVPILDLYRGHGDGWELGFGAHGRVDDYEEHVAEVDGLDDVRPGAVVGRVDVEGSVGVEEVQVDL